MSDDLSIPSPTYRIPRHRQGMDPATRRLAMIAGGLARRAAGGGRRLDADRPSQRRGSRGAGRQPADPGEAGEPRRHAGGRRRMRTSCRAAPNRRTASWRRRRKHPRRRRCTAPPAAAAAPSRHAVPAPAPVPAAAKPPQPKPVAGQAGARRRRSARRRRRRTARWSSSPRFSSEDAAKSEWQRLSKRLPDLLGQRKPAFSKTEHDGKALWRVRTGGFADVAQATAFCEKVRAKGAGCSVADF